MIRIDRKKQKRLCEAVIVLAMTVGSLLSFLSAVDTADCTNTFSSPWNGLLQLENAFLLFLTRKTGRIHLLFSCVQNRDYIFAASALSLVFALIFWYAVREKKAVVSCLPGLCLVLGHGLGLFRSVPGLLLFLCGFLLSLTQRVGTKSFLLRALSLTLSVALVCAVVFAAKPSAPNERIIASLRRTVHSLRYEKNDPLPEGDLRRDTTSAQTDDAALRVQMQTPQSVYLRGFVGDIFDGVRWTALDNAILSEYADLFYWLHEYDFYSSTQTMYALQAVGGSETQSVQVTNLSACKRYAFLPTVCRADDLLRPEYIRETLFAKEETYTAQMPLYDKAALFAAQRKLAQNGSADGMYMQCERAYAQFVYATALDVPDSTAQALERQIQDEVKSAGLADKICFVLDWFRQYTHTKTAQPFSGSDAAAWFLEQAEGGNDAMFATASVLMLRYLGIPARYTEGYITEGGTVKRSDAHAWAEYYLDGIGWIPLETLPELTRTERTFYEQRADDAQTPPEQAQIQRPQSPLQQETAVYTPSYGAVFAGTGGAALLVLAAVLLLRRLLFRKRQRTIRAMNPKERIPALFSYAAYVQEKSDVSLPDTEAQTLRQEALFSDHTMTQAHVNRMEDYVQQTVAQCKQSAKPLQKLRHRFWDCLY